MPAQASVRYLAWELQHLLDCASLRIARFSPRNKIDIIHNRVYYFLNALYHLNQCKLVNRVLLPLLGSEIAMDHGLVDHQICQCL